MRKPSIILIGAGGHARACIDVIEEQGTYQIAGLLGKSGEMHSEHLGYKVIATDEELSLLAKKYEFALVSVGQIRTSDIRSHLYITAKNTGFQIPTIISPHAYVSQKASIGAGTIVMHGAVINANADIGKNCIINTGAVIEHDVIVREHSHISTGAIVNGNAQIGEGSFVGSGSIIKEGVSIGNKCIIGMGLSVRKTQLEETLYVGT